MKKRKFILAKIPRIFLIKATLILGILSAACAFPVSTAATDNGNYFGYIWANSLYTNNSFSQINSYSNTAFVSNEWLATDINALADLDIASLQKLKSAGMKGIVDLSSVFWVNGGTYPLARRTDWESRFNTYWAKIYPYLGSIAAFYPIESPDITVNWTEFNDAAHIIKINVNTVPYKIPVLLNLAPSGVLKVRDGLLPVSGDVGWLSFMEFDCWGRECYGGLSIAEKLDILISEANKAAGRKVMVIPKVNSKSATATDIEQVNLGNNLRNYHNLCLSRISCNGVMLYYWDNIGATYGANTMPTFLQTAKTTGISFLGRDGTALNPPKMFGYYWTDDLFTNNTVSKVNSYSNISYISNIWKTSVPATLAIQDIANLNQLKDAGMKGVIDLAVLFWSWDGANSRWNFRTDWKNRFDLYWSYMKDNLDKVAAFYPVDEPTAAMWDNYRDVSDYIKINTSATNYNIPIMLVNMPSRLADINSGAAIIPGAADIVGFDDYDCWTGTETGCFGGQSYQTKLDGLIAKAGGRKIVMVPKAFSSSPAPAVTEQQFLATRLGDYYSLCIARPTCWVMAPFLWDTTGSMYGANTMPVFQQTINATARGFISQPFICSSCASGLAKSLGNANCDSKINAMDFATWKNVYSGAGLITEAAKAAVDFNCQSTDLTHTIDLNDFLIWAGKAVRN